jgi:aspartate carbamoyltransferase catalytic subunit
LLNADLWVIILGCLNGVSNIISIKDFTRDQIIEILKVSAKMENTRNDCLKGKCLATLFFEPSTRTRLSFEASMMQLGGGNLGFADAMVSSAKKGETLYDTIKVMTQYVDIIVIRHNLEGAARVAAEASTVPVINGGDGANQHPTQTFIDLYTISKTHPQLLEGKKLKIALMGDLRYGRTVHSLLTALSYFNVEFKFISPPSLQLSETYRDFLKSKNINFDMSTDLDEDINTVDVLYVTRIQEERFPDPVEFLRVRGCYKITANLLKNVKKGFKILHPLPRVFEIDRSVDELEATAFFEQAGNGIPVRKALLHLLLNNHEY